MTTIRHLVHHSHTRVAFLIGVLALMVLPANVLATHDGTAPEMWPAWYDGQQVTIMMGPSGNSQNPNQMPSGCFGLGPDLTGTQDLTHVPIMYGMFVRGATQMSCPDGRSMHDMVFELGPGDPGYRGFVRTVFCVEGVNFDIAAMPYTSAAAVRAAAQSGALQCGAAGTSVRLAQFVR